MTESLRETHIDFTPQGPRKRRDPAELPTVPSGWWEANVPPTANPVEIVALVTRLRPSHPKLPMLTRMAKRWKDARGRDAQAFYRCPSCLDNGWIETDRSGRSSAVKCDGPMGTGCMR